MKNLHSGGTYEVSILVLLDDAYRLLALDIFLFQEPEFQSLFFWMMPTGMVLVAGNVRSIYVSILVLLDDAYRRISGGKRHRGLLGFNPCSSG